MARRGASLRRLGSGVVLTPLVTEEDVVSVSSQMRSFWIGRGVRVAELEEVMRGWVGVRYAVALGSGTAALAMAIRLSGAKYVNVPQGACEAIQHAVQMAGAVQSLTGIEISIYPSRGGLIEDFARHLPLRGEVKLDGRFGVFSFGALKDVSGGIGGCLVANEPIASEMWKKVSPISDINAAMILSQLDRYKGPALRLVAGGLVWGRS